jgi:hypothetical protein
LAGNPCSLSPADDRLHLCGALCLKDLKVTVLTALNPTSGFVTVPFLPVFCEDVFNQSRAFG